MPCPSVHGSTLGMVLYGKTYSPRMAHVPLLPLPAHLCLCCLVALFCPLLCQCCRLCLLPFRLK